MRYIILLLLLISVSLIGLKIIANPGIKPFKTRVDEIVIPYLKRNQVPGAAVAIYYRGKEYYFNYGFSNKEKNIPVTNETIFELASVTKVFTATLLALQVEDGRVSLDESIANYIPPLEGSSGLAIDRVTFKDLATHTASFPRNINDFKLRRGNLEGLIEAFKTWQAPYRTGTHFYYSNIGFGTLGYVVGQAASLPYPDLLLRDILKPLNMRDTFIYIPSDKLTQRSEGYKKNHMLAPYFQPTRIVGGGELHSTSKDLMQFLKANLQIRTAYANVTLLNAMQLAQQPYFKVNNKFTMGLGWQRVLYKGELFITKDGANHGFNSFIGFSPEHDFGIVVLVNAAHAHIRHVSRDLLLMMTPKKRN